MPVLNGNGPYVTFNGNSLAAIFVSVSLEVKNTTMETTAGTNVTHKQRLPGLNDTIFKIDVVYNTSSVSSILPSLFPSAAFNIEYGPEGNVSGKPRHVQAAIIQTTTHMVKVTKDKVMFSITAEASDAPSVNMFAGGVYP